jgi:hypothetical protein
MITRRHEQTEDFIKLLTTLDSVAFIGVAKLLHIELFDKNEDKKGKDAFTPRDANILVEEVVSAFYQLPKNKRKELLKVLKQYKKEGEKNGSTTKS